MTATSKCTTGGLGESKRCEACKGRSKCTTGGLGMTAYSTTRLRYSTTRLRYSITRLRCQINAIAGVLNTDNGKCIRLM